MPVERQQMVSAPGNAFSDEDMAALEAAVCHLEYPSLAVRLSSVVGTPIEMALELLPRPWYQRLHASAESVVSSVFIAAVANMGHSARVGPRETLHKELGMVTGAAGGLFGLPGLAVELPVSTAIMLRAIAEIARDEGEDVRDPEVRMACVQVFALGGRAHYERFAESAQPARQ